jgi:hypothetical protein
MFRYPLYFLRSFTALGLILGTLFFAASLTPSLVPRHPAVQGVLSGFCLAAGYGLGVALRALWLALKLPVPADKTRRIGQILAILLCAGVAAVALWQASEWQNRLRALMDMPPVDGARTHLVVVAAGAGPSLAAALAGALATLVVGRPPYVILEVRARDVAAGAGAGDCSLEDTLAVLLGGGGGYAFYAGGARRETAELLADGMRALAALVEAAAPAPLVAWLVDEGAAAPPLPPALQEFLLAAATA